MSPSLAKQAAPVKKASILDGIETDRPQQCRRILYYDIELSGIHTGTMTRVETWKGNAASITSHSQASILGIGTQYKQYTELSWSNQSDEWLTDNFHQQVSGFKSRDMKVAFSNNGRDTDVDIDGDITHYHSKNMALRDVDTLAVQIRHFLLQGRTQFALIRQASDAIEPYQFYVQPQKIVDVGPWKQLTVIPIKQTGAEDVTYYYSPDLDFQLVQARYHGIILQGLLTLNEYDSTCQL